MTYFIPSTVNDDSATLVDTKIRWVSVVFLPIFSWVSSLIPENISIHSVLGYNDFNFLQNNTDININSTIYSENLVIINSKIVVSNEKLSYIDNRSIYSEEQRYEQLLETIESVKKYMEEQKEVLEKLESKDWLYEQRIVLKKSKEQIASELGCSITPVNKWIKIHQME